LREEKQKKIFRKQRIISYVLKIACHLIEKFNYVIKLYIYQSIVEYKLKNILGLEPVSAGTYIISFKMKIFIDFFEKADN